MICFYFFIKKHIMIYFDDLKNRIRFFPKKKTKKHNDYYFCQINEKHNYDSFVKKHHFDDFLKNTLWLFL